MAFAHSTPLEDVMLETAGPGSPNTLLGSLALIDDHNRIIARERQATQREIDAENQRPATRREIARDKSDAENIWIGFLAAVAATAIMWGVYYVFNDKYGLSPAIFNIAKSLSALAFIGMFIVPLVYTIYSRRQEGKAILPSISNLLQ